MRSQQFVYHYVKAIVSQPYPSLHHYGCLSEETNYEFTYMYIYFIYTGLGMCKFSTCNFILMKRPYLSVHYNTGRRVALYVIRCEKSQSVGYQMKLRPSKIDSLLYVCTLASQHQAQGSFCRHNSSY